MRDPGFLSAVSNKMCRHGGHFAQMPEDGSVIRIADKVGEAACPFVPGHTNAVFEELFCHDGHAAHETKQLDAYFYIPICFSDDGGPQGAKGAGGRIMAGREKGDCIQNVCTDLVGLTHGGILA